MEKKKIIIDDLEISTFSIPSEDIVAKGGGTLGVTDCGGFTCGPGTTCSDTRTDWSTGKNDCSPLPL